MIRSNHSPVWRAESVGRPVRACLATLILLWPAGAAAIPPQVALAGISFMLPVIPLVSLLIVTGYLAATRHSRIKGFLGRLPGALALVVMTILVFAFFVKLSTTLGGIFDPVAEKRLVDFLTDNAIMRHDIEGMDDAIEMVNGDPPGRWKTPLTISAFATAAGLKDDSLLLVDVRMAEEYSSSHVEGSWRFPRGELESVAPDFSKETASDVYLDALVDLARREKRTLAFCCSYGVSVSVRTVLELRHRDIDAVMVTGGCAAMKPYGIKYGSGPAKLNRDLMIRPELLDRWRSRGLVHVVTADEATLRDLGRNLPYGPIVVATRDDSPQDRSLRVLVSALAHRRGIAVAGQAVTGAGVTSDASRPAEVAYSALLLAGNHVERVAGIPGLLLVLLLCSCGIMIGAARVGKSRKSITGWCLTVLFIAATCAFFVMLEGSFAANRMSVFFGRYHVVYPLLYLLAVWLIYMRFFPRERRVPYLAATAAPLDPDTGVTRRFQWQNVIPSAILALAIAAATPPAAVFTVCVIAILSFVSLLRKLQIRLLLAVLARRLKTVDAANTDAWSRGRSVGSAVAHLAAVVFPVESFAAVVSGGAVHVNTRVSGRPGMIRVRVGDMDAVEFGVLSLLAADGTSISGPAACRVRLVVAMAAQLGLDLDVDWGRRRLVPSVKVPSQANQSPGAESVAEVRDPDSVRDDALHRQILAMLALEDRLVWRQMDRDDTVLSGERYIEQDPAPTPLTFSVLASRTARRGPAHKAGLLFGFSNYYSRTVRLGAGIYEVFEAGNDRQTGSRLRALVARQFIRAMDAIWSDTVLPRIVLIAESAGGRRDKALGPRSLLDVLVSRVSMWQEVAAISHSLIMAICLEKGGEKALERFDVGREAGQASGLLPSGTWELKPSSPAPAGGVEISLDLCRILTPFRGSASTAVTDDISLWRRAEYYRAMFRRVNGWMTAVIGRTLQAASTEKGLGDLVFFCSVDELDRLTGRGRHGRDMIPVLQSRKDNWEILRNFSLPTVVKVSDLEGIGCAVTGYMPAAPVDVRCLSGGFLVSGRLPVCGKVRLAGYGLEPGVIGPDVIAVLPVLDPAMLVKLLDCAAVVSEVGGRLSHAAMLAREFGLTVVSGVQGAVAVLRDGDPVTIGSDCVVRLAGESARDRQAADVPEPGPIDLVDLIDAGPECGNKALNLGRLLRAGFRVPPGCVLPDRALRDPGVREHGLFAPVIDGVWRKLAPLNLGQGFIVRSSAGVEDGSISSFAGAFVTVSGINDLSGLAGAVKTCLRDDPSGTDRALGQRLGIHGSKGLSLIIQPIVPALFSGVAVSTFRTGEGALSRDVMIEAQPGVGGVVAGTGRPEGWVFGRGDGSLSRLPGDVPVQGVGPDVITEVARVAIKAETLFGCPQDIEWCFDGRDVWIVQSRPVVIHD